MTLNLDIDTVDALMAVLRERLARDDEPLIIMSREEVEIIIDYLSTDNIF